MNLTDHFFHDETISIVRDANFDLWSTVNHKFDSRVATYVESKKFLQHAISEKCYVAFLTTPDLAADIPDEFGVAVSTCPKEAFFRAHNENASKILESTYSFRTQIPQSARIHPRAWIAEFGVKIGENVLIEPNAVVLSGSVIGSNCKIRAGAIIGSEGFEFKKSDETLFPVTHIGGVCLEESVEIQSLSTVARGVFLHSTKLGESSKIDSHVHVAHAAKIGKRALIAAGAVISGSCIIGDDVWIGPNSTISNGVKLGDRSRVNIGSTVVSDVAIGESVSGNFAIMHSKFLRNYLRNRNSSSNP